MTREAAVEIERFVATLPCSRCSAEGEGRMCQPCRDDARWWLQYWIKIEPIEE